MTLYSLWTCSIFYFIFFYYIKRTQIIYYNYFRWINHCLKHNLNHKLCCCTMLHITARYCALLRTYCTFSRIVKQRYTNALCSVMLCNCGLCIIALQEAAHYCAALSQMYIRREDCTTIPHLVHFAILLNPPKKPPLLKTFIKSKLPSQMNYLYTLYLILYLLSQYRDTYLSRI